MNAHAVARDRWLARATAVLGTTSSVAGAALVGSLGRGDGDEWSDVDVLVFIDGDPHHAFDDVLGELGTVGSRIEAPQNTRADADSFGVAYLVDGLPVATDWYVFPRSLATWPADATPIVGTRLALPIGPTFAEVNATGMRGTAPTLTDEVVRRGALVMTIVEAKQIARGRGARSVTELRRTIDSLRDAAPALAQAIGRYLDLVESTISQVPPAWVLGGDA